MDSFGKREAEALQKFHLNTNYIQTLITVLVWDVIVVLGTLRLLKKRDY